MHRKVKHIGHIYELGVLSSKNNYWYKKPNFSRIAQILVMLILIMH